ncbi:Hypothetical predicted protein [Lecanosticta acicola]|uniref:Uncharacterized protein n=1 Tax=Lecanosticta acicola TaxID=111012 RepID=A0AAI8YRT2_9PEZI|nr:Hypothetical predicted protein [Lecanosticta acicola]
MSRTMQIPKTTLKSLGIYFCGIFALLLVVRFAVDMGALRNYQRPGPQTHPVINRAILISTTGLEVIVLGLEYRGLIQSHGRRSANSLLLGATAALLCSVLLFVAAVGRRARLLDWMAVNWFVLLLSLLGVVETFLPRGEQSMKAINEPDG